MNATIDILGQQFNVDYEFEITHSGSPMGDPNSYGPGDPAEPAEFEITVYEIDFPKRHADVPKPELPGWLKDLITTHLSERDDINDIVQTADQERGMDDYD